MSSDDSEGWEKLSSIENELGDLDQQLEQINALIGKSNYYDSDKGNGREIETKRRPGSSLKPPKVSKSTSPRGERGTLIKSTPKNPRKPNKPKSEPKRRRNINGDFVVDEEVQDFDIDYNDEGSTKKKRRVVPLVSQTHTPEVSSEEKYPAAAPSPPTQQTPALNYCYKILEELMKHEYGWPFLNPVDPVVLLVPDYFSIITEPMDLTTIHQKFLSGFYATASQFGQDVNLVWKNAMAFNEHDSEVYAMAKNLSEYFDRAFAHALEMESPKPLITKPELQNAISSLKDAMKTVEQELKDLRSYGIGWSKAPDFVKFHPPPSKHMKFRSQITVHPFSESEKAQLHENIHSLPPPYLRGVVQIIEEEMPHFLHADASELLIDIDQLDSMTLSRLEFYTKKTLTSFWKMKKEDVTEDTGGSGNAAGGSNSQPTLSSLSQPSQQEISSVTTSQEIKIEPETTN